MTDFNNPTAKDMRAYFASLPPDTPFRVVDPDTGWVIHTFRIEIDEGKAWLSADYSNILHGDEP